MTTVPAHFQSWRTRVRHDGQMAAVRRAQAGNAERRSSRIKRINSCGNAIVIYIAQRRKILGLQAVQPQKKAMPAT